MKTCKNLAFLVDFLDRQGTNLNELSRRLGMYKTTLTKKFENDDMKISEIIEIYDLYNYDIIFTLNDCDQTEIRTTRLGFLKEFQKAHNLTNKDITDKCEFNKNKLSVIFLNDNCKISIILKIAQAFDAPLRIIENKRQRNEFISQNKINSNDIIYALSELNQDPSITPGTTPISLKNCIELGLRYNCKLYITTKDKKTLQIESFSQIKEAIKNELTSKRESIKTLAVKTNIDARNFYHPAARIKTEEILKIFDFLFQDYKLTWKKEDQEIEVKHYNKSQNVEILQELQKFMKEHSISRKMIMEKLHIEKTSFNRMFNQNTFRLKRIEEITSIAGYKPVVIFNINNSGKNQIIGQKRVKFLYEIMVALNLTHTDLAAKMKKHRNGIKTILENDDIYIKDIETLSQELGIPYTIKWEKC